jgi:hypothetical protein
MLPSIDLQRFRDKIEQLFAEDYTHQQLAHWLADQGLVVTPEPLSGGSKTGASWDKGLPPGPRYDI